MSILFKSVPIVCVCAALMSCAGKNKPCEDILEVKRQTLQCERCRKIMNNNNYPQQLKFAMNKSVKTYGFIEITTTQFAKEMKQL